MSQKHLLLISIGPVQDFIASARKLRDLWFGSNLLSELAKTVARTVAGQGGKLIFPAPESDKDLEPGSAFVVANKILAEVTADDPAVVIAEAKKAWRKHITRIGDETLKELERFSGLNADDKLFAAQLEDVGEFYAGYVPLEDGKYGKARESVEKLVAGRKNLRGFSAPVWEGGGLVKNSLDGIRECVTGGKAVEIKGLLKKGERLDALGCVKRFHFLKKKNAAPQFNDLADIALVPYKQKIGEAGLQDKAAALENLTSEEWFRNECLEIPRDVTREIGRPFPYACILVGDGDNMGAVLDAIPTVDGHRIFSKLLAGFAASMDAKVEEFGGSLIYSGGDDVMAYLPLHTMLEAADSIRKEFSAVMKKIFDQSELKKLSGKINIPTFSIGLTVVHYSEPLNRALELARAAERTAKTEGGRNALALNLSKRGGAPLTVCGKWDEEKPGRDGLVVRLQRMAAMYLAGDATLPATLGYQLREAVKCGGSEIGFKEDGGRITPDNAASAMVLRIFRQKDNEKQLVELLQGRTDIRELSDELVIAKNIATASAGSRQPETAEGRA